MFYWTDTSSSEVYVNSTLKEKYFEGYVYIMSGTSALSKFN